MSYEILTESYGRRLPKITATADSTDDLTALGTNWAEGSTCTISDTTYKLDKVGGWVDPSSGGGSSLPPVTADDNGDVLTVVEGAWNKAAPSGGGGLFFVSATYNEEDESTTVDKTLEEINAAYLSGLMPVIDDVISEGDRNVCPMVYIEASYCAVFENYYTSFSGTGSQVTDAALHMRHYEVYADGTVQYHAAYSNMTIED